MRSTDGIDSLIRRCAESDVSKVGVLIADTFGAFNLSAMTPKARKFMLGPFALAHSPRSEYREAVAKAISAPSVWVADQAGEIVGVLRGGRTDDKGGTVLSSLFVGGQYHRKGVGRALVGRFEQEYAEGGPTVFKLASTLHAIPFYLSVGYQRSTGVRPMAGLGDCVLPHQPMRKMVG